MLFFVKQKTAYEMRISDWSSDVCSSDLVYLVPIVMLFGVGMVPGIVATIIFALPPVIRLTNLGIRGVPGELVEAAYAFGPTPRQELWEVQIPLALRTIIAGLNQNPLMSLSMVVVAALIGAGGLGPPVSTRLARPHHRPAGQVAPRT